MVKEVSNRLKESLEAIWKEFNVRDRKAKKRLGIKDNSEKDEGEDEEEKTMMMNVQK
jgi:hypothetical protein